LQAHKGKEQNKGKVAYGSHRLKESYSSRQYVETRVKMKVKNAKLNVLIRKTEAKSELLRKYGIEKYDLHPDYEFPNP